MNPEKRNKSLKIEKNILKPIKISLNTENINYNKNIVPNNYKITSKKSSPLNKNKLNSNNNNSLINKNIHVNFSYDKNMKNSPFINKYSKDSLFGNFNIYVNKKNNTNKLKKNEDLFPYIKK